MIKIIKITSKEAKKYTKFKASYGFITINSENEVKLFLDDRYLKSATKQNYQAYEIKDLPRKNCILNPWEWSIAEFERFNFENYKFENTENCIKKILNKKNIPINIFEKNKSYLISNQLNTKCFCDPFIIKNKIITKTSLENLKNVFFDKEITFLYFLPYLNLKNAIEDPQKTNQSIIKNLEGYKEFLKNEAIAWCLFWQEIEENYKNYTEISAANKFFEIKKKIHGNNISNSFKTIIASKENSQYIHYTNKKTKLKDGVLLIDAGIFFNNFCSDISRTFFLGNKEPDVEIKKAYTQVLKAHIAVATLKLNDNEAVSKIDLEARKYVEFAHALGHGVGEKNVHVYPTISSKSKAKLKKGMIITNEPGFYNENFGIRLESLMHVKKKENNFIFEYLNYIPFEKKLIIYENLNNNEIKWLSKFDKICYKTLLGNIDANFLSKKIAQER